MKDMCAFGAVALTQLAISLADVQIIVGIVSSILTLLFALVFFILKLYTFLKDGKLSEEEKRELLADAEKIKDSIEDIKEQTANNENNIEPRNGENNL